MKLNRLYHQQAQTPEEVPSSPGGQAGWPEKPENRRGGVHERQPPLTQEKRANHPQGSNTRSDEPPRTLVLAKAISLRGPTGYAGQCVGEASHPGPPSGKTSTGFPGTPRHPNTQS